MTFVYIRFILLIFCSVSSLWCVDGDSLHIWSAEDDMTFETLLCREERASIFPNLSKDFGTYDLAPFAPQDAEEGVANTEILEDDGQNHPVNEGFSRVWGVSKNLTTEAPLCGSINHHFCLQNTVHAGLTNSFDGPDDSLHVLQKEAVEGDAESDEALEDNAPVVRKGHKKASKKKSLSSRQTLLLQRLEGQCQNFEGLKDLYKRAKGKYFDKSLFHADVLQAMCKGADIIEEKHGYYRFVGMLESDTPASSESVAVAMFNLLRMPQSLFELRFKLYRKGYRQYTPDFLTSLEMALKIANVHPYDQKVQAKDNGVVLHDRLLEVWLDAQNYSKVPFYKYVREKLANKMHRQVLLRLCELTNTKDLENLRALKKGLPQHHQAILSGVSGLTGFKSKRRTPYLRALMQHEKEWLDIKTLWQHAHIEPGYVRREASPLRTILLLTFKEGYPIIYDQNAFKVTFLGSKIPVVKPREDTNLLTMVYDCLTKHGEYLTKEEFAYYAYRGGYWPESFDQDGCQKFYKSVDFYKEFLVTQRHIRRNFRLFDHQAASTRKCKLWDAMKEKKFSEDFAFYKKLIPDITQEDLDHVLKIKAFESTKESIVFSHYIQNLETQLSIEEFVQRRLCQHPLREKTLWRQCTLFGVSSVEVLWDVVKGLTQRKTGGRLIYEHKTTLFFWDSDGVYETIGEEKYVAEVFLLQRGSRDISNQAFMHMLIQQGVEGMTIENVRKILKGLELLGLRDEEGDLCRLERKNLRAILTSRDSCAENHYEDGIAQEVFAWLVSGALEHLWRAYLQTKDDVEIQEEASDTEEQSPPCKYQKLEEPRMSAEEIIARDIPELNDFLSAKGF